MLSSKTKFFLNFFSRKAFNKEKSSLTGHFFRYYQKKMRIPKKKVQNSFANQNKKPTFASVFKA